MEELHVYAPYILLVTVKEWLKSVLMGIRFLDHPVNETDP